MTLRRYYKRSFAGGLITPEMVGRLDDVKHDTGLAECYNFSVLPHGPVENRPGTQYVNTCKGTLTTRLIPFYYSETQTLVIEIGEGYFRFHTNGATLSAGSPAAYSGATAYTPGDLVSSGGVNYYCIANTTGNAPPNATYWYAMPSGVFEVPNPYSADDVLQLRYAQSQDVITLTHPSYPPKELQRLGATDWVLVDINFVSDLAAPSGVSATATSGSGSTTYKYKVTAVDSTGREEGPVSAEASCTNDLLGAGTPYNTVSWSAVTDAARYNVYKDDNGLFGFIGQTASTSFKDENITADVGQTPPIEQNLFASTDNYPRAVSYYEQRRCFGGTNNNPQNIFMTRSGTESNMSYSIPTRAVDAINFRIAARDRNVVEHLVPLVDLLALSSFGVWMVTSLNTDSIEPDSIAVRPQARAGVSTVQPVVVDNTMVFEEARSGYVRGLGYSAERNAYAPTDLYLRAIHLFRGKSIVDMTNTISPYSIVYCTSSDGTLLGMTYLPQQEVVAWHQHATFTNAGDVDNRTQSNFKSVCAVTENGEDAVYVIVERVIDGTTTQYIERFASRAFDKLHDAIFVDCSATYDNPFTITGITKASPGVVTTSSAHGFSNGDPIDLREVVGMTEVNYQRYYAANVTSTTFELTDQYGNDIDTSGFTTYVSGGEARKAISSVTSGLDHLEGETVAILADGAVQNQKTVTGGAITLDEAASIIHIGLPIQANLQTLPAADEKIGAFGQGMWKNVNEVFLKVYRSSGIFAGPDFDSLTEFKQRIDEPYGSPPALKTEELSLKISGKWTPDGSFCIRQDDPLPLTLLAATYEVSVAT